MLIHTWLLLTVLFAGAIAFAQDAQSPGDSVPAFEIYKQRVYPFMRKNCKECHSEIAIYPAGPLHSQSQPDLAYRTFLRYVQWQDPDSSKAIRMAMNRHYCLEHGYNCPESERIAMDAAEPKAD